MYFPLKQYDLTMSGGNEIFLTVSKCLKGDYNPEQISNLTLKKKMIYSPQKLFHLLSSGYNQHEK